MAEEHDLFGSGNVSESPSPSSSPQARHNRSNNPNSPYNLSNSGYIYKNRDNSPYNSSSSPRASPSNTSPNTRSKKQSTNIFSKPISLKHLQKHMKKGGSSKSNNNVHRRDLVKSFHPAAYPPNLA